PSRRPACLLVPWKPRSARASCRRAGRQDREPAFRPPAFLPLLPALDRPADDFFAAVRVPDFFERDEPFVVLPAPKTAATGFRAFSALRTTFLVAFVT